MGPTVSFGDNNFGPQVGINNGTINNAFNYSPTIETQLPIVPEALFNPSTDQHENECLEGTRVDLLRQIKEWAFSPQDSREGRSIFWLNGMAGTGKSTISRTLARYFNEIHALGASFFFKRGEGDRGNATKLISSIVRQLVISLPRLRHPIEQAIHDDPHIVMKGMKEQFNKLILHPLFALSSQRPNFTAQTVIIVIDALDECEKDDDIRLILHLLPQLQRPRLLHLRVFITSRPELEIRAGFSGVSNHEDFILHKIAKEAVSHDLALFLSHRLSKIRTERSFPIDWPGESKIHHLVRLSSSLFIFAATICRMFEDRSLDPGEVLAEILVSSEQTSKLDRAYLHVLNRLVKGPGNGRRQEEVAKGFQQVVGAIVTLESPLSIFALSNLLNMTQTTIQSRLDLLHSVLSVPNSMTQPVRLFHLSFRDFLLDPETRHKSPLWIDSLEAHGYIAMKCLSLCQKSLRQNICQLPGYDTSRKFLDYETLNRYLPPEMHYACRHWVYHLTQSIQTIHTVHTSDGIINNAVSFLRAHFLHWVEAMILLGLMSEVVVDIDAMLELPEDTLPSTVSEFLVYGKRFVLKNSQIIYQCPLQLYCSALLFSPSNQIGRIFEADLPSWLSQIPQVYTDWSSELQSLEGHEGPVLKMIFSPDGRLIANVCGQFTLLWDLATGNLEKRFVSENFKVLPRAERDDFFYWEPLVFSPDSRYLASVSLDGQFRVWDRKTKTLHETSHRGIQRVQFSPDSQLFAVVAHIGKMITYDLPNFIVKHTFAGYSEIAPTRIFCPGGLVLASGFVDGTLDLTDLVTREVKHRFKGHSNAVDSLQISADGRILASLSVEDRVIKVWDTTSGSLNHEISTSSEAGLISDPVPSRRLAFSPNNRTLAFVTNYSLNMWDFTTHTLRTQNHSALRNSYLERDFLRQLAFSPDGSLLLFVETDGLMTILECATWLPRHTHEMGLRGVFSTALAPNNPGFLLASGGRDGTVLLRDLAANQDIKSTNEIREMVISHDRTVLVSRSPGKVHIWDTMTGDVKKTLSFSYAKKFHRGQLENFDYKFWEPRLQEFPRTIDAMALSLDNRLLAQIHTADEMITIWDTATFAPKRILKSPFLFAPRFSSPSVHLAFARNGWLASSVNDNIVLWDSSTGAHLQHWTSAGGKVANLDFFEGEPSSKPNLHLFSHETSEKVHLRTNFGALGPGEDISSMNPLRPQGERILSTMQRLK
ncbi:NACHT and WD40 domain protein [Penicillium cosmopolitanum]|uniref:NACHT and WD40 domain protein n=1 Tax=Penicillium cosmopolitanum TaxID=1131564 RepID=A0A9W9SGY6_9EURO|nr:NACHT and WD40 domain protein [Penicillium cosmopolitanum]KAJ5375973.1 NACHT and WD40 domain protein [Penicillium cosmopolitanum]